MNKRTYQNKENKKRCQEEWGDNWNSFGLMMLSLTCFALFLWTMSSPPPHVTAAHYSGCELFSLASPGDDEWQQREKVIDDVDVTWSWCNAGDHWYKKKPTMTRLPRFYMCVYICVLCVISQQLLDLNTGSFYVNWMVCSFWTNQWLQQQQTSRYRHSKLLKPI